MLTETKTSSQPAGNLARPSPEGVRGQLDPAARQRSAVPASSDPFHSARHIPIYSSTSPSERSNETPHRAFADSRSNGTESADRVAFISNLAIGLGHDIGNIVLPMLCYLDSLDSLDLPADAKSHVRALRESAMHLKRLSNGLNLFAHDSGDWTATAPQTNLHLWWREIQPLARKSLARGISLKVQIPEDLPAVNCPAHQLTLAIINLISNAGEAISDRGTVNVSAQRGEGRSVLLSVSDTGAGMPEDVRRRALDPFFTTKRRSLSTGLGLTQVNDIAKSVGGRVTIESTVGQGTTVTLTLQHAPLEDAMLRAERPQRSAAIDMHDARIASYARTLLEDVGFSVHHESTPAARDSLMVVQGGADAMARASEFVRQGGNRRAIVLSSATQPPAPQPGVVVIDQSHRALQRELQHAARDLF